MPVCIKLYSSKTFQTSSLFLLSLCSLCLEWFVDLDNLFLGNPLTQKPVNCDCSGDRFSLLLHSFADNSAPQSQLYFRR
jgi:hypothetical protein